MRKLANIELNKKKAEICWRLHKKQKAFPSKQRSHWAGEYLLGFYWRDDGSERFVMTRNEAEEILFGFIGGEMEANVSWGRQQGSRK